jgi:hypothetical protein
MDRDRKLIISVALLAIAAFVTALVLTLSVSPQRPIAATPPAACGTACAKAPATEAPPIATAPAPAPAVAPTTTVAVAAPPLHAASPSTPPAVSPVSQSPAAPSSGHVSAVVPPPAAPSQTAPLDELVTSAVRTVSDAIQQVLSVVTPRTSAAPALPPGGVEPPSAG